MSNPQQYRDKAAEYSERGKHANGSGETHEFARLEKSFTTLAENEQWLSDNYRKTIREPGADLPAADPVADDEEEADRPAGDVLAEEEEHVLRCLGAALLMRWNTVPTKLQRELFDDAGSMGELLDTASLRAQIARFLHRHKNDAD